MRAPIIWTRTQGRFFYLAGVAVGATLMHYHQLWWGTP